MIQHPGSKGDRYLLQGRQRQEPRLHDAWNACGHPCDRPLGPAGRRRRSHRADRPRAVLLRNTVSGLRPGASASATALGPSPGA